MESNHLAATSLDNAYRVTAGNEERPPLLEPAVGLAPTCNGFAIRCITILPRRRNLVRVGGTAPPLLASKTRRPLLSYTLKLVSRTGIEPVYVG